MNEKQKEGLARVLDNLATASIIGLAVGIFGEAHVNALSMWLLLIGAFNCLGFALDLRSGE